MRAGVMIAATLKLRLIVRGMQIRLIVRGMEIRLIALGMRTRLSRRPIGPLRAKARGVLRMPILLATALRSVSLLRWARVLAQRVSPLPWVRALARRVSLPHLRQHSGPMAWVDRRERCDSRR
jgi:hypothetical protein